MKLKGKLILSCAALAAVATTAFSTTYAWYTSNSTVTATGISASTAQAASDALQISLDGNSWGATVDLTNTLKNAHALTPVERTANVNNIGTYKIWSPNNNAVAGEGTSAANYVQFPLYFRNVGTKSNLYITGAQIVNETAASTLPGQKLLSHIASYTTADSPEYTVDLLRALNMEIATQVSAVETEDTDIHVENFKDSEKFDATKGGTGADKDDLTHPANVLVYRLAGNPSSTDTLDNEKATNYNAHTYYNSVKGLGYSIPSKQPTSDNFADNTYYTQTSLGVYEKATSYSSSAKYYIFNGKYVSAGEITKFENGTTYYLRDFELVSSYEVGTKFYVQDGDNYVMPADQPTSTTFKAEGAPKYYKEVFKSQTTYNEANKKAYYILTNLGIDETKDGDYFVGVTRKDSNNITIQTVSDESDVQATSFDVAQTTTDAEALPILAPNATTAAIKLANTNENTIVKVTFTIYLNGWDIACFDACKGQNISMNLTFGALTE